jgi:nucleotide-binding universal stress UspA family protein
MRRYLVVANQTLSGGELVRAIAERAEAEPSEFFVLVPATPLVEMWVEAVMLPYGGILCEPDSAAQARELAEERLKTAAAQLRAVGAAVHGQVGDRDPVRAVQDVLRTQEFDEIIVSTLPGRLSRWLRQDLPHRLEQFALPVTHVVAVKQAAGQG